MASRKIDHRLQRGNKVIAALQAETDRGKACVGDAMLDELIKEMFLKRLILEKDDVQGMLSWGRPLGSHGARLKMAYLLGWIGPDTYHDCDKIHAIRNRMAHSIEVDSLEHPKVRDLLSGLRAPHNISITVKTKDGTKRANLFKPQDRLLMALMTAQMRCWASMDRAKRQRRGQDAEIFVGPRRLAAFLTDPKIPNTPIP
jgi:DNA-binding MltR family transcriptional regulator